MRYFIGYLIRGEAAEYYKATCADLVTRFGVTDISAIVPPHIKVKAPFERAEIEPIDNLMSLSTDSPSFPLTLSTWNHFGTRTVYIDVPAADAELSKFLIDFLDKLRSIGLPMNVQERDLHMHLSVARFLKGSEYENVWKYIQTIPAPHFDLSFDNLTLFSQEKDERVWKVVKTYPLMGLKK